MDNPYAIYVNCDGATDYDSANSGGIGFMARFPDFVDLDPISASYGTYVHGNIEVLELQALISAFQKTIEVVENYRDQLVRVPFCIF